MGVPLSDPAKRRRFLTGLKASGFSGLGVLGFSFVGKGLGFRVWGLGFRVWGLGFRVWGFRWLKLNLNPKPEGF